MLAYRKMKKIDFSFVQVCSYDHVFLQYLASPFVQEMKYIGCPNGYNVHSIVEYFQMHIVDRIILLT